jgi:hypothetical protein
MRQAITVSMALAPAACIVVVWPAVLHAQSDDQAPSVPAFNQADIPTAAVTPGVKFLLEGITFDRADHLGIELNVADFWRSTRQENSDYLRNIVIVGEVAPVGGEHARARELGDWRIGVDWAIIDQTNLFRPEAIEALRKAGGEAIEKVVTNPEALRQEQGQILHEMTPGARVALNALFDRACAARPAGFGPEQWVDQPDPEVAKLLIASKNACAKRSGQQTLKKKLVDALLAAVEKWLSTHRCDRLDIDEPFPALGELAQEWATRWDTICAPRKKVDWATLEATRKRLATGLVLSAEVFLVGHTEVSSMMDGSDDVTLSRTVDLEISGEATYRNEDRIPIDATLNLFRLSTGPGNVTSRHGLTANVASPAMRWSDSGMILSVTGGFHLDFAGASSANVTFFLQQRLAVPLANQVFLILDVSEEWIERTGWGNVRPSFSLAWSYAKDGKDLARAIETSL